MPRLGCCEEELPALLGVQWEKTALKLLPDLAPCGVVARSLTHMLAKWPHQRANPFSHPVRVQGWGHPSVMGVTVSHSCVLEGNLPSLRDSVYWKQVTRYGPTWEKVNKDRHQDVDPLGALLEIVYVYSLE